MPVVEMTIGEFIASVRADRKLSLRAFAQYIGTSQTAVSDWEKGNRVPDPESCRKLARYLHMPEEEVLRMAGHMAPAEESKPEPLIIPPADRLKLDTNSSLPMLHPATGCGILQLSRRGGALREHHRRGNLQWPRQPT